MLVKRMKNDFLAMEYFDFVLNKNDLSRLKHEAKETKLEPGNEIVFIYFLAFVWKKRLKTDLNCNVDWVKRKKSR